MYWGILLYIQCYHSVLYGSFQNAVWFIALLKCYHLCAIRSVTWSSLRQIPWGRDSSLMCTSVMRYHCCLWGLLELENQLSLTTTLWSCLKKSLFMHVCVCVCVCWCWCVFMYIYCMFVKANVMSSWEIRCCEHARHGTTLLLNIISWQLLYATYIHRVQMGLFHQECIESYWQGSAIVTTCGWNSNMASSVTMYIIGYIILCTIGIHWMDYYSIVLCESSIALIVAKLWVVKWSNFVWWLIVERLPLTSFP